MSISPGVFGVDVQARRIGREKEWIYGLTTDLRTPSRISSHRPTAPQGCEPYAQTLPHAHLRTEPGSRKVKILVFFDEAAEGQEGQWRDCQPQCGTLGNFTALWGQGTVFLINYTL